jgi:GTP-binding protein Era
MVALAGRPNVGKSTLMNHLLGRKLAITSRKPQTTRHALLGIHTVDDAQIVFVDTPGIHLPRGRALNRYMLDQAVGSLAGVDLAIILLDAIGWRDADDVVLGRIREAELPCIAAINKIDRLKSKESLLPYIDMLQGRHGFLEIVPVSALRNIALDSLTAAIIRHLPEAPHLFGRDEVTDRPAEFLIGETVREKAMRRLGAELPHQTTVVVERIERREKHTECHAVLYVERDSQKRIMIGKGGAMLKSIGEEARKDIERMLGRKVMLRLWVKVAPRWSDSALSLRRFGYRA